MKRLMYITLLAAVFSACNNKPEEDEAVKKEPATQNTGAGKKAAQPLTDGPYTETHPNGQIKIKGEIKNGQRSGTWFAYYPNGTKESEMYYEDGKKNGKSATYYPNGHVRYIGYYKWDKPDGTWEFFNEDGTPATKRDYKN